MTTIHQWVKSTYSGGEGGDCVEWSPTYAATHHTVPVRDSKNPTGPTLMVSATAWTALLSLVTDGN
ncbi:DUF397 domain-containing protein [Streptomyces sp. NBC_01317]|uniref:DUF397 domain-containing protein n=1 Tax=Streptomyces sp. NBC_01317 TaxID=2903822 RepID=UPI002E123F2F|nr:DUF397 domain-containing protein [Streptomyces sp. NBC_01317]